MKQPTILIAEDELFNRMYLNELFDNTKYTVVEAVNGEEAVNLVLEHQEIALVLMDIKMPVMNGDEALVRIKSERADLPVIALTGLSMASELNALIKKGFDSYLVKPIDKAKLFELIQKHIN